MRPHIPAVVAGLNLNGLAVVRCLGRQGIPVIGVTSDPGAPAARSRYLRAVWVVEGGDDALVPLLLARARENAEKPVLLPVTDAAVAALGRHAKTLAAHYRFTMPAPERVLELLSKEGFARVATALDLPVPPSFFCATAAEVERVAAAVTFPCILKPQVKTEGFQGTGAPKAFLVADASALTAAYATFAGAEPRAVVQEFIPGGDGDIYFCLHYLDREGRGQATFTGRKIRQWRPLCGGTSSCEPAVSPELADLSLRFFRETGFTGICSMEFKRDPRDGRFWLIEPTVCRTDWQSALADANGLPIPYLAYCDLVGLPPPTLRPRRTRRWAHLAEDRLAAHNYRQRGELGLWSWLWSLRPPIRWAWWALDDPRPFLAILKRSIRARFR